MKKYAVIFFAIIIVMVFSCISVMAYPNLKYHNAGTYETWTEESYYCSPTVCDLDGDGKKEIIFSNYSITVLDGATGETKWKVNSGKDRNTPLKSSNNCGHTWSDVEVHDINGDGKKEIITAHGNGLISVLSYDGYFLPGWPQTPKKDCSAKSLEVADLDGDGKKEIVVGYATGGHESVYVLNYDGKLRNGWPQIQGKNGVNTWIYGVFMDNIVIDDLNYDGLKEIIVPSDLSFVSVFEPDGSSFKANKNVYGDKSWGQVALFEDYAAEIRGDNSGWGFDIVGNEMREELYKGEFGHSKAIVYDVDKNGSKEVIVTTIMCNRKYAPVYPPTEYMTVAVFNSDRTRYRNDYKNYNWEVLPMDLGEPLVQNKNILCSKVFQYPVVSDLDGDGKVEILFNSYNGKVHCFGLDKKEPYAWPYSLTRRTSPKYEYASPVVCKDINGDGKKEVIFTSFFDDTMDYDVENAYLYILNYEGRLLHKVQLPDSKEKGVFSNGSMAMPVVDDVDNDGKYEIVINTRYGAICVYNL